MPTRSLPRALALVIAVLVAAARPVGAQPFADIVGQRDDPAPGNSGIQVVTVVNTATNQKVARFPVGLGCLCVTPESVAVSPDGSRVYVTNEQGSSVSVIATSTNTVIDTVPVGNTPAAVDVSPTARVSSSSAGFRATSSRPSARPPTRRSPPFP